MDSEQNLPSFWFKVAKFLGACAAVITAITGLLALLDAVGYLPKQGAVGPRPPEHTPLATIVTSPPLPTRAPRPTGSFTPTPEPDQPTATVDLAARYRPSLKAAITLGDNAEIQAQRYLDPRPLYTIFTGEVLKIELAAIQNLANEGVYLIAVLENQDYHSFKVSDDGRRAEVRLVETWSVVAYSVANQACVSRVPSYEAPQTVFLERGAAGWLIYAIEYDSKSSDPIPC